MKTADKELILATLDGDRTAFEMLIRKYQSAVYGFIYSLVGNFSDAQDLTQEAFIRAYLDLHQLKDHAKFASWLCQVARNICRMWNRRQKMDLVSLEHSIEMRENGVMEIYDSHHNIQLKMVWLATTLLELYLMGLAECGSVLPTV